MANKYPATTLMPSEGGGQAGKIRCSHLLVKHDGSRRPSSWKEVSFSPSLDWVDASEIFCSFDCRA